MSIFENFTPMIIKSLAPSGVDVCTCSPAEAVAFCIVFTAVVFGIGRLIGYIKKDW